ncbi:MAG TPA: DegT/DnrJ/EryC1/StrS family aminotransferase [Dehalococcoidia bacterium]|nr:DegT/DnrJ/EryC1/StrS family aminotransferase [Dehalococcoidia bacterium]
MNQRIRISQPAIGEAEEQAVLQVLRSGHLAQGPAVRRFEALCAAMAGTRHAVAVSNGTVALEAALRVCDLTPGDEVITSAFTFAATLNAILHSGAVARFADIGDDFNVDPGCVEDLIGPRTKVLMPVHLYGLMADMTRIEAIAQSHGVRIVEDAAQAHGAAQDGRAAGSFGLGCFSFYATKNVTSGEGGCITCDDEEVADELRIIRNQGMRERYQYERIGDNWRMTDVAAAIAVPQLERIDTIVAARNANAALLHQHLVGSPLVLPITPQGRTHVWHQYTVLLPDGADREGVRRALDADGIDCGVYYPSLVWDHAAYRDHPNVRRDATPRAAAAARRCLSLPVHPGLTPGHLERVAVSVRRAVA